MSQPIGLNFRTRIPTFSEDASIEEALSLYHYGVDNYSSQAIPEDSIEGHFTSLESRIAANEFSISQLSQTFIEEQSSESDPNQIVPENENVVPLTITGAASQSAPLQRWQNDSSVNLITFFPNGGASFAGYVSIGDTAQTVSNVLNIQIGNSTHKGIVVQAAASQTGNLQEWQNSTGDVLAKVDNSGTLYSNDIQVATISQTQTLTNKTLTNPVINGGQIINGSSMTLSGAQDNSSRVRNITFSTLDPSGGNDGDLWVKYI